MISKNRVAGKTEESAEKTEITEQTDVSLRFFRLFRYFRLFRTLLIASLSKVEPVNVRFVEDERRAQFTSLQFTDAPFQDSRAEFIRGVNRQIAQVEGVPQHHAFDHAVVNIRFAQIRQRQADHFH